MIIFVILFCSVLLECFHPLMQLGESWCGLTAIMGFLTGDSGHSYANEALESTRIGGCVTENRYLKMKF